MEKERNPIPVLQFELLKALDNIGFIATDGEVISKTCKSNAVELIKKVIKELDQYK